jgi:hypothetical protein
VEIRNGSLGCELRILHSQSGSTYTPIHALVSAHEIRVFLPRYAAALKAFLRLTLRGVLSTPPPPALGDVFCCELCAAPAVLLAPCPFTTLLLVDALLVVVRARKPPGGAVWCLSKCCTSNCSSSRAPRRLTSLLYWVHLQTTHKVRRSQLLVLHQHCRAYAHHWVQKRYN